MQDMLVSLEDLQANRAGRLSATQRAQLAQRHRTMTLEVVVILVFILILLAAGFFILRGNARFDDALEQLRYVIIGLIILLPLMVKVRVNQVQTTEDLRGNSVKAVRGTLHLSRKQGRFSAALIARIGISEFTVSQKLFDTLGILQQGSPECALYYTPASRTIIAFEPI